jgi:hypothetical protein
MKKRIICLISCLLPLAVFGAQAPIVYPENQALYDIYPWSVMYYYGQTMNGSLFGVLTGDWKRWPEHIQSVALAHTLAEDNVVRRFFSPLVGVMQVAGNATVRYGKNEHTIYEFDPMVIFRWANFPWNHYINTSFALAEGVSYDTSIPSIEKRQNTNTKRFLNYLFVELTVAPPSYPRVQLVGRCHHRSGVYGLDHAGNTGSNVVGLGGRYLFD